MDTKAGQKEKCLPGKGNDQGKNGVINTKEKDTKKGESGRVQLPMQKVHDRNGKEEGTGTSIQMLKNKAKAFKIIVKQLPNNKESQPRKEVKNVTDGMIFTEGVNSNKNVRPREVKEDCLEHLNQKSMFIVRTDEEGLLKKPTNAENQQNKTSISQKQEKQQPGVRCLKMNTKQEKRLQEVTGKTQWEEKKTEKKIGDHQTVSQTGTARPRYGNDKSKKNDSSKKVSSFTGQHLSDAQYHDIFHSVLDSSLEDCLKDAQIVMSEVKSLQAKVNSCKRFNNKRKRKLPLETKETAKEKPKAKKKPGLKERRKEDTGSAENEYDLWVQCSRSSCLKWRKVEKHVDPFTLSSGWTCCQSTDPECNSCECPEESWTGSEEDVVHSSLVPGSLVWAQQQSYPWWPGMAEKDPDTGSVFLFNNVTEKSPAKYHITFFGKPVTRAWLPSCKVKPFQVLSEETALSMFKSYKKKLHEAVKMAKHANTLPVEERLSKYGFGRHHSFDRGCYEGDISEIMANFDQPGKKEKTNSYNKVSINKPKRNRGKKTSKEQPTASITHNKMLKEVQEKIMEKEEDEAADFSLPRPQMLEPKARFQDKTVPEVHVGRDKTGKEVQKQGDTKETDKTKTKGRYLAESAEPEMILERSKEEAERKQAMSKDPKKALQRAITEQKEAGSECDGVEEKNGGMRMKKSSGRVGLNQGLEESEGDLLQEDIDILNYQQNVPKELAFEDEDYFMFFEE